jgi:hypothetical protein
VARLLVERGAEIDSTRDVNLFDGPRLWTPLMEACDEQHAALVRYLLARGADPNHYDGEAWRPLDAAIKTEDEPSAVQKGLAIAALLLEAGAKATKRHKAELEKARRELAPPPAKPRRSRSYAYQLAYFGDHKHPFFLANTPKNGPEAYRYDDGVKLARKFPARATLKLCSIRKHDTLYRKLEKQGQLLADFVRSSDGLVVASPRARSVFEELGISNLEYLPVSILGPAGQLAAKEYWIVNVLGAEHAVDMKRSKYRRNPMSRDQIDYVEQLVLDRAHIDADARLFRAVTMKRRLFVREDIAQAIERAGLTGFRCFPSETWQG